MSFKVSNEFFIRAPCFVRVGYTRTIGIQRKPLTADHQTGGLSLQQQYTGHPPPGPDCHHIDKTTNYYNTTLAWSGKEMKIYVSFCRWFFFGFVVEHEFLWSHCKFNSLSCFNECESFLKILNSVQSMDCDLRIQSNCNSLVDIFLRFTTLDRYLKKSLWFNWGTESLCAWSRFVCRYTCILQFDQFEWICTHWILIVAIKILFMHLQLICYYPHLSEF